MDWLAWLVTAAEDPLVYLPLLFAYALLATVLLPIPVEFGLLNPFLSPVLLILTVAAGKAAGGALVFPLGTKIGEQIERYLERFPRLEGPYRWIERVTSRHGYWALFAFLSIPFMTDSVPVYVFSILNPRAPPTPATTPSPPPPSGPRRRVLRLGPFVAVNFVAALVRCSLFLLVPLSLGWR